MNESRKYRAPLKLSEEELRQELSQARDQSQNYSKCSERPYRDKSNFYLVDFNGTCQIRDLELIIRFPNEKPNSDDAFWESLFEKKKIALYTSNMPNPVSNLSIMSNIILCAISGRKTYQDFDGDWHIPLYGFHEQPYNRLICFGVGDMPEHRLSWVESPFEQNGHTHRVCLDDFLLRMDGMVGYPKVNNDQSIMLIIHFKEPTLLERVVLHQNNRQEVFRNDQIWSIDFMKFKIYGIALDPQIQDYVHLAERITYYADHPQKITAFYNFGIKIKTYPPSVPVIRPIVLQPSTSFSLRIPNDPL